MARGLERRERVEAVGDELGGQRVGVGVAPARGELDERRDDLAEPGVRRPTTATTPTAGCSARRPSTSAAATFSPPTLSMSLRRLTKRASGGSSTEPTQQKPPASVPPRHEICTAPGSRACIAAMRSAGPTLMTVRSSGTAAGSKSG